MTKDRSRRGIIAAVVTVLWLGYMAVGLALIIVVYRHYRTTNVDQINQLKG